MSHYLWNSPQLFEISFSELHRVIVTFRKSTPFTNSQHLGNLVNVQLCLTLHEFVENVFLNHTYFCYSVVALEVPEVQELLNVHWIWLSKLPWENVHVQIFVDYTRKVSVSKWCYVMCCVLNVCKIFTWIFLALQSLWFLTKVKIQKLISLVWNIIS